MLLKLMDGKRVGFFVLICGLSLFSGDVQSGKASIDRTISQAGSEGELLSIVQDSKSTVDQIAVINMLPGLMQKYSVDPSSSTPSWLDNVLIKALYSGNSDLFCAAANQISRLKLNAYTDRLISLYGGMNNSINRVMILRTLGDLGDSKAIPVLEAQIAEGVLCPETDEAIISARKMCASGLMGVIGAYCSNLNERITKGEFAKPAQLPLTSPDVSLMVAQGSYQIIAGGACGK